MDYDGLSLIIIVILITISIVSISLWVSETSKNEVEYTHIETTEFPIVGTDKSLKVYRFIKDHEMYEVDVYTEEGVMNMNKYLEK